MKVNLLSMSLGIFFCEQLYILNSKGLMSSESNSMLGNQFKIRFNDKKEVDPFFSLINVGIGYHE